MSLTAKKIVPSAPTPARASAVKPTVLSNAKPRKSNASAPTLSVVKSNKFENEEIHRIKAALQGSSMCVMIADMELRPVYVNDKMAKSLKEWEPEFQKLFGIGFQSDKILGRCIDDFHKDPAHQRRLLANESIYPYQTVITVGPLKIELAVNVVKGPNGEVTGYTTEWNNITERLKADEDYKAAVQEIAERIEFLRANCATDLNNAMSALAKGDFTVVVTPKTPLLEIPSQPDLALMAETFNELRNQTVSTVVAYNKTKDDLAAAEIAKATSDAEYKAVVGSISERMEMLRSICITGLGVGISAMAEGNLTVEVVPKTPQLEIPPQEDLALMSMTFNNIQTQMVETIGSYNTAKEGLSKLVAQVQITATNISDSSNEVMTGNDDLAQRTEEQAASLEETASSMEEMTSTVKQNADNAKQANQLAMQARESAEKGGQVVTNAVSTMEEINSASKRISDIISVIDEIAFQTNLLALNAAVEAARVGEQGRGFAVVAAEVRNLAGRSATAAKEIKALVNDSVQKVQEGSTLVNQSGTQLEEIVNSVKKVADIIAEITAAAQEQSAGIEQVNKAIIQMDQITQQNAALVEEASAASQSMNRQALGLQEVIGTFTVDQAHVTRLHSEIQAEQAAGISAAKKASRDNLGSRPTKSAAQPARRASTPSVRAGDIDDFEEF